MLSEKAYIGDLLIINDKSEMMKTEDTPILKTNYPYEILKIVYGGVFIQESGRIIKIHDSDWEVCDLIEIAERVNFQIGDKVKITEPNEFDSSILEDANVYYIFTVARIVDNEGLILHYNNTEYWVRKSEERYLKKVSVVNENNKVIEQDMQKLIDDALDKRDFKKLEELKGKFK